MDNEEIRRKIKEMVYEKLIRRQGERPSKRPISKVRREMGLKAKRKAGSAA